MVVIPRLDFLAALRVTQASTALISVVPGGAPMGMAITFGMLRSREVISTRRRVRRRADRLWNQVVDLPLPGVGSR